MFVTNLESGKIRIYLYQIFTLRKSYVIRVYTQMQIKVFEDSRLPLYRTKNSPRLTEAVLRELFGKKCTSISDAHVKYR